MRRIAASSSSPTPLQQQQQQEQQEQQEREQQLSAAASRLGAGSPSQLSNRLGAGSPSQLSVASESNQTLITGHLRPKNTNPNPNPNAEKQTATATAGSSKPAKTALVLVQESPPIMTPAGVAQQSLLRSDALRAAAASTNTDSGTVRCDFYPYAGVCSSLFFLSHNSLPFSFLCFPMLSFLNIHHRRTRSASLFPPRMNYLR
jgi:hypothetical protein